MGVNAEQLAELLKEEIIPEIQEYIDELFEKIETTKNATEDDKEAFGELQEMHASFKEMLVEAESGIMDEDECSEIIAEIEAMRTFSENE